MPRKIAVSVSAALLTLLAVFFAQLLFFCSIIGAEASHGDKRVDLVLAFDGDPGRIPAAFREARKTESPRIVFSSSQKAYIEAYPKMSRKRYHGLVSVVGGAYTTDQNARTAMPVVREMLRGSSGRRALLVTSWYHLPRAYFLTRLYSVGSGIEWSYASAEPIPPGWWKRPEVRSELLRFWGSMGRVCLAAVGITDWPRPAGMPAAVNNRRN